MGSGHWSSNTYAANRNLRASTGTSAFTYTDDVLKNTARSAWKTHADLNPFGVTVRESRDSTEHPTSLAIAVIFDVTGSMHRVPRVLQNELPKLLDHMLQNNYVEHPQLMFGAIGDATAGDPCPLQIGQFESDNRMEDVLGNIALVGGGGGGNHESYELALYFMARHTSTDCFEQRGKKGYLFLIADECAYPEVVNSQLLSVLDVATQETLTFDDILKEVLEKWELYYLLPTKTSHGSDPETINFWKSRLGDHFLAMADESDVVDQISMVIATNEAVNSLNAVVNPAP